MGTENPSIGPDEPVADKQVESGLSSSELRAFANGPVGQRAQRFVFQLGLFYFFLWLMLVAGLALVFREPNILFVSTSLAAMGVFLALAGFSRAFLDPIKVLLSAFRNAENPDFSLSAFAGSRAQRAPVWGGLITFFAWLLLLQPIRIVVSRHAELGTANACSLAFFAVAVVASQFYYYYATISLIPLRLGLKLPELPSSSIPSSLGALLAIATTTLTIFLCSIGIAHYSGPTAGIGHFMLMSVPALLLLVVAARAIALPIRMLSEDLSSISAGGRVRLLGLSGESEAGSLANGLVAVIEQARERSENADRALRKFHGGISKVIHEGMRAERSLDTRRQRSSDVVRDMKQIGSAMGSIAQEVGRALAEVSGAITETELKAAFDEADLHRLKLESVLVSCREELQALMQSAGLSNARLAELATAARSTRGNIGESGRTLQALDESAKESVRVAQRLFQEVFAAGRAIADCLSSTETIRTVISRTKTRIESLDRWSTSFGEIVQLIDDLATRTNLLSLNAAIIAAQAGEHGRPFHVVSEHISELAAQIARSTKRISEIVGGVQSEVDAAGALIRQSADLSNIGVDRAKESSEALGRISVEAAYAREVSTLTMPVVQSYSETAQHLEQFAAQVTEVAQGFAGVELLAKGSRSIELFSQSLTPLVHKLSKAIENSASLCKAKMGSIEEIHRRLARLGDDTTRQEKLAVEALNGATGLLTLAEEDCRIAHDLGDEISTLLEEARAFRNGPNH